jgi:hypothetical protein
LWPDLGKQQQTVIDAVMDTVPRLRARGIAA